MQDLRLVFKRNIEKYTDKKHCNFPYEKINFIHYGRGLGMPSIFYILICTDEWTDGPKDGQTDRQM